MVPPPSPSSTSWHSAASSATTAKSVSFALPPYSHSSPSQASFACSSSSSSSGLHSGVVHTGLAEKLKPSASTLPKIGHRASHTGPQSSSQHSTHLDGSTELVDIDNDPRRSRLLSRRSVRRLTTAPPFGPPKVPLPELPLVARQSEASVVSNEAGVSVDINGLQKATPATTPVENLATPLTGLAYLAPTPIDVSSPDGLEAIGHIALQSCVLRTPHAAAVLPQASPAYNLTTEDEQISTRKMTAAECVSQPQPSLSYIHSPPDAVVVNTAGPKHPSLLPSRDGSHPPPVGQSERPAHLSVSSVAKDAYESAPHSARGSLRDMTVERGSNSASATTWSQRLKVFMKVYDKSDDSSHSLPRLHRIMEPFLLLVPLLIGLYLLGSAIVPFEWWRARLSIARVGLAGQSADSEERMVDGEEVGLFGVWGWCVLNSDEVARCSQAKFGYTMDSLVDDIGFTNFSKGLLDLPNGIFYAFLVHSLAVTFCGIALLISVHHSWKRNVINNSRHQAGWLQHGTILAAVLTSLAAYIVDKLFVFFVKEKLKLDITRQSSDSIVESGERDRAAEDSLERGEAEIYLAEKLGKKKIRAKHLSNYSETTTVQTERGKRDQHGRRNTLKAAHYKKREQRAKATRRAKRRTLIQGRRSTWRSEKEIGEEDSDSDFSVDDYDDIERRRREKKWAREAALEAELTKRRKESEEPLKGSKRKAKNRLSRWYHGDAAEDSDEDEHPARRRDTLGHRLSIWFQDAPRPSKSKKRSRSGKKHKKADSDEDEVDEGDDLDYDRILKLALQDPDKISLLGDQESADWSDEEYLNWSDGDLEEASGEGKKR